MSNLKAEAEVAKTGATISGFAIAGVLVAILVLVGIAIYISFPGVNNHFLGLVAIGFLGLIVSVLAVVVQSMSRDPAISRAASAGSFWFGVAVLLGAGLVSPDGAFHGGSCPANGTGGAACQVTFDSIRLVYIIIILFIAVAGLLYMRWQLQGRASDLTRASNRAAWRAKTGVTTGATGAPSANDPRSNPPAR